MQVINGAMTRPLDYEYLKRPAYLQPQRFYELLSYQMSWHVRNTTGRMCQFSQSIPMYFVPMPRRLTFDLEWENVRSQMNKVSPPDSKQSGYVAKVKEKLATDDRRQLAMPIGFSSTRPMPQGQSRVSRPSPNAAGRFVLVPWTVVNAPALPDRGVASSDGNRYPGSRADPAEASPADYRQAELVQRITPRRKSIQAKIGASRLAGWKKSLTNASAGARPAYLVEAIKNDYAAPKGFITRKPSVQRQEPKPRREKERLAAEERRRKQQQEAGEQAAVQAVNAYWASLTPQQQAELDAAMDAQADAETLAGEHRPAWRKLSACSAVGSISGNCSTSPEPAEA